MGDKVEIEGVPMILMSHLIERTPIKLGDCVFVKRVQENKIRAYVFL